MITKMSLTAATAAPDSPENIAVFEKAMSMLWFFVILFLY